MPTNNSAAGAFATGLQSYTAGNGDFTPVTFVPTTTWVPNIQINGVNTGITYSLQNGIYQQVGNAVHFSAYIILTSKGSQTGNVTLSNLPISSGASGANVFISCGFDQTNLTTNYTGLLLQLGTSTTVGTFFQIGAGQTYANLTNAQLTNASSITLDGVYFII